MGADMCCCPRAACIVADVGHHRIYLSFSMPAMHGPSPFTLVVRSQLIGRMPGASLLLLTAVLPTMKLASDPGIG